MSSAVSSSTFKRPPLDFSLTLLDAVDFNIQHNPDHPVFRYLKPDGSIHVTTWKEAGVAFYTAARIIQTKCHTAHDTSSPVTVGVLANTDSLTYISVVVGTMLAGFVPFLISNRNSPAAVAHLLRATDCKALLISEDQITTSQVEKTFQILENDSANPSILSIPVPSYATLYETTGAEVGYPPLKKLRQITQDSPCVILHSSGSVAFPKPVRSTYRIIFEHALVTSLGEVDICEEIFAGHALPIYHALGFYLIPCCFILGTTLSLLAPTERSVPSPDLVLSNAIETQSALIFCVPSFLETWAQDKGKIAMLKRFKTILFGGGPLLPSVGDMLIKEGINVAPMYGTTEVGGISLIIPQRAPVEGWEWLQTGPGVDLAFVPSQQSGDNVYRLIVKASAIKTPAVVNTTIDGIPAYDTNDLIIRHPTNPSLWKILGREDDQIMHSTGEKTNPTPIEARLVKDPKISTAIMFGRSKFQAGVLILPSPEYAFDPSDEVKLEEYRNMIWTTVEEANKDAPQHSRIFKELILVATPSKPFEYTAKGTPRRHVVLKAYESEIEAIYEASESRALSKIPVPTAWSLPEIRKFMRAIVVSVLEKDVSEDVNIFTIGGDSLAAISIRNTILRALRESRLISTSYIRAIPSDLVYMFSSVDMLSAYVFGIISLSLAQPQVTEDESTFSLDSSPEELQTHLLRAHKGPAVVKLRKGKAGENPLIILHGAGGSIVDLLPLLDTYHSAFWAMHVTEDTPMISIEALAKYYHGKIKLERPTGPYRLAAYSGSSLLLVKMVQIFESNGDEISQFAFLDHFPTLYLNDIDESALGSPSSREEFTVDYSRKGIEYISKMVIESSQGADQAFRAQFGRDMLATLDGQPTSEIVALIVKNAMQLMKISLDFVLGDAFYVDGEQGRIWSKELITQWMKNVKKTPTVYVAKAGAAIYSNSDADLGAKKVYSDAKIVTIEGNHFNFLGDRNLAVALQEY